MPPEPRPPRPAFGKFTGALRAGLLCAALTGCVADQNGNMVLSAPTGLPPITKVFPAEPPPTRPDAGESVNVMLLRLTRENIRLRAVLRMARSNYAAIRKRGPQ